MSKTSSIVSLVNEDSIFSTSKKFQLTSSEQPMCQILGRMYYCGEKTNDILQEELGSLLFFSYRKAMKEFQYLSSSITSDSGWGCSLRTSQMMFAQALKRHLFEKRVQSFTHNEKTTIDFKHLISMFLESKTAEDMTQSPFGFHSLLTQGINLFQIPLKQQYSPVQGIKILKKQFKEQKIVTNLKIITSSYGVIFKEDIRSKMKSWEKSLLLILHFKLGTDKINEQYIEQVKQLMDLEYFVGAIGGIKNKSLFTVGYMNNQFLSMDPHIQQTACKDPMQINDEELSTFFPKKIRADSCNKYASDITFAFYLRSDKQYNIFLQKINGLIASSSLPSEDLANSNEFFIGVQDSKFDVGLKHQNSSSEFVIDLA